jgi:hypothetical protein
MDTTLPIVGYIHQGQEYMPVYEGGLIARESGRDVPAIPTASLQASGFSVEP